MFNLRNPFVYWGLTVINLIIEIIPFVSFSKCTGAAKGKRLDGFGTESLFVFDEHYQGEYRNGELNGKGKFWFGPKSRSPGENYEGDFVNGKMHGTGTLTLSDGQTYVGEFLNNKFHGRGETRYPNGDTYEGNFENNYQHGFGVYTFADGEIQSGKYEKGEFVG